MECKLTSTLFRREDIVLIALLARFQWVKIWIALFYPLTPIGIKEDAERLLAKLEGSKDDDKSLRTIAMPRALVDAYNLLLKHNAPAEHLTERKYMIRAYHLLLSCKEPWTCDTLCQAVSIQPNGTLDDSVKHDRVRSWCLNFFKISKTGVFEISHDSARQFLGEFAKLDTLDGGQQDFSLPSCNLAMAELCLQVMAKDTHEIWKTCDVGPRTWKESWKQIRHPGLENVINELYKQDPESFYYKYHLRGYKKLELLLRSNGLEVIVISDWSKFAVYVCVHWLQHWTDVVLLPQDAPMNLVNLIIDPRSVFNDWAFFILMVNMRSYPAFNVEYVTKSLKWLIINSLKEVDHSGETSNMELSPLLFLIGCNMFDTIYPSLSRSIQENLRDDQSRQQPIELGYILKDRDSPNAFGHIATHIAARQGSQQTLEYLIESKSCEKQALLQYLSIPDKSGRTVLHLAVDENSSTASGANCHVSIVRHILSNLSSPERTRLLGVRDNNNFTALETLVQDFEPQRRNYQSFWKANSFSTVYDELKIGSPPLNSATNVALLKTLLTRGDLEASWAEALYNRHFSKDPELKKYLELVWSDRSIIRDFYP